jgi:FtsX-like permease family
MTAHWVVLAAAALTTLVAAIVAAALATFAGQGLPQAVRHELTTASGTALSANGPLNGAQVASSTASLKTAIHEALPGIPFAFWQASWSDSLGLTPGALPARPASTPTGSTPLIEAAALPAVSAHAVLVAGQWPSAPAGGPAGGSAPEQIPAALPASAATLLHVSVGDVLQLRDRVTGGLVTLRITGLFAQRQLSGTAAAYWRLNSVPASGSVTLAGFSTYGPAVVNPAAFGAALPVASATWVAQPDMTAFTDSDLNPLAGSVSALQSSIAQSGAYDGAQLNGVQLSTGLADVLAGTASNLTVARSLLAISAIQLLVLAVAALLAVARLLATQRETETALLTARGATRWQLTRLTAVEVIPLCCVAAVGGTFAGIRLAQLLAGSLYHGDLSDGGIAATAAGTWLDALIATLAVAVIASAAMLFPVLHPGPAAAQVRRGRGSAVSGAIRAGADLGLVALAVLAGWQLRRYSAVSPSVSSPTPSIDPVLVLAPALALAGGTVLTLRLLPAAARAGDRLAARGRKLTASLASWQFSRQPLRQGGAALLLVMAVATGTLALVQHASWTRSANDQAAFAAGADVTADLQTPLAPGATGTLTRTQGVRDSMAAAVLPVALPSEIMALDAARAAPVVQLRGDQSQLPADRLFRAITPAHQPGGTELSGQPTSIRLTATIGLAHPTERAAAAETAGLGVASAVVTIADATGATYQIAAGTLPVDGRPHVVTAPLSGGQASYPLRLIQLTFSYTLPGTAAEAGPVTLTVADAGLAGWSASATSVELSNLLTTNQTMGTSKQPQVSGWHPQSDGGTLVLAPGYGQGATHPGSPTPGPPLPVASQVTLTAPNLAAAAVPAIATKAFLDASNTSVGATVSATIEGITVPVDIVAETTTFPTVSGGALIMDLATIQDVLTSRDVSPLTVNQWWLATAGGQVPPGLATALPPGSTITSRAALAAAAASDPLSAAPQQALLAVTGAAALLAVTGFWVSIAANVRQRRAENALLAALGVAQRSAAAQLFLEKLLLSVPSAVLGLLLGSVVARLLVPAVTLTTTAQQPVPPPVTVFDLAQTVPLAAFIAIVPALAAALVVIRRPDPAAELRAAEAA